MAPLSERTLRFIIEILKSAFHFFWGKTFIVKILCAWFMFLALIVCYLSYTFVFISIKAGLSSLKMVLI